VDDAYTSATLGEVYLDMGMASEAATTWLAGMRRHPEHRRCAVLLVEALYAERLGETA